MDKQEKPTPESKPEETTETPAELSEKELDQIAGGITIQPTINVTEVKKGRLVIKLPNQLPGAEGLCAQCGTD